MAVRDSVLLGSQGAVVSIGDSDRGRTIGSQWLAACWPVAGRP